MEERERHVFLTRVAEEAERYDEMVEFMKKIARMDVELTPDERNLLSIGYKNAIGAKRVSWRTICLLEEKEKDSEQNVNRIGQYRKRIEDEIAQICNDILSVIDIHILPSSATVESTVFFTKMKGDYYRYLAEFKTGDERKEAADQSLVSYQAAASTAVTDLPPSHPTRLGLALNLSVFYYEIMNDTESACQLAKQAFDEALPQLNSLDEKYYKESRLVLQLLRDNLTMWTARQRDDDSRETNADTNE